MTREDELKVLACLRDHGLIAKAMKARDMHLLHVVGETIRADAPKELAATDPALYRTMRHLISEAVVAGYEHLDAVPRGDKLDLGLN
jgi:hypothetical protein